ncbi:MAG: hypothetical protein LHV69_07615 [Elusimicrobia bacterium]|nr:hypothetical protein [Candidatus Obscuribacterium magneticum]
MVWPKKEQRERLEIDGFIEAYRRIPPHYSLEVLSKAEKPDYVLRDEKSGRGFSVELTSVYLNDRSVPDVHMSDFDDNDPYPQDESLIPKYTSRLATAVKEKIDQAKKGYDLSRPLILSVYVNEYVSIFMSESDWDKLVKDFSPVFGALHPFEQVVFWKLANNRVFSVSSGRTCFV